MHDPTGNYPNQPSTCKMLPLHTWPPLFLLARACTTWLASPSEGFRAAEACTLQAPQGLLLYGQGKAQLPRRGAAAAAMSSSGRTSAVGARQWPFTSLFITQSCGRGGHPWPGKAWQRQGSFKPERQNCGCQHLVRRHQPAQPGTLAVCTRDLGTTKEASRTRTQWTRRLHVRTAAATHMHGQSPHRRSYRC